MKQGSLSEYFQGVAAKRLTEVEANVLRSNQHEFNGVRALREMLGEPNQRVPYPSKMMYLSDSEPEPIVEDALLTWYDARQKAREERGVMRDEYRLYFPSTSVSANFGAGDVLVIAHCQDGSLLLIVAKSGSSVGQQIEWLFGVDTSGVRYVLRSENDFDKQQLSFASRVILETIGLDPGWLDDSHLDEMINLFGESFPTTLQFSAFSRSKCMSVDTLADPDHALMAWMEKEEQLFRALENHIVSKRLKEGFLSGDGKPDVDSFISYSLSVQNRRKSRVGLTLENHLEHIFKANLLRHSRTARTENRSKPDFLFPSQNSYLDLSFDSQRLIMLGVKSTCKDRWRQVLTEADRVEHKHLLTLEAPISTHQLYEMRAKKLALVVPSNLHDAYPKSDRGYLISLAQFIQEVQTSQNGL
ncbi:MULTISPECIES: type II restriction endonuclease [Stenotrophomonas]|uniref:type II restriction endonuclease n=1 Tax=Stenotrophomonas TaxID=40323 RepID=UPI00076FFE2F|nr:MULTISPECIES: type II restriction endonuclease [Stenotrophomonas]AMJ57824.1 restriction endonuclease [Stenotrophomonas sp. KCTC 12332]